MTKRKPQQTPRASPTLAGKDVPSGKRNIWIDVLRGLSISLVLLHHFNIAYRLEGTLPARLFGWPAVRALVRNGNYGVTIFFVISGFLITRNTDERWNGLRNINAGTFYGYRAARILPCLLLLLLGTNLLALTGAQIFQNHAPLGIPVPVWLTNVASLTLWMNVLISHMGWVNYPLGILWSLSVEEMFYLSFPVLCIVLRREALLLALLGIIIVVGPLYRLDHQGNEAFLYDYFACFDGIAIGCAAALLGKRIALRAEIQKVLAYSTAGFMTLLYLILPIRETNVLGVTGMAAGTAVLLLCAQRPAREAKTSGRAFAGLCWLGKHSYEIYLFHLLVLGGLRTFFLPSSIQGDDKLLLLLGYLGLSSALAALIARYYSTPLSHVIRRRLFVPSASLLSPHP